MVESVFLNCFEVSIFLSRNIRQILHKSAFNIVYLMDKKLLYIRFPKHYIVATHSPTPFLKTLKMTDQSDQP